MTPQNNSKPAKHKVPPKKVIGYLFRLIAHKLGLTKLITNKSITPLWQHRILQYGLLMRVDKPIGTLLLLWPTMWALWLASDSFPSPHLIVIFVCGVFLMRSAGCVINDYADRDIDNKVSRTRNRPLTVRKVTENEALMLFMSLALVAFALVLLLNKLSVILSFVALTIAIIYPYMKRVTYFPQVVLGMAFSMAIPMAFAAVQNEIPLTAWLLYITNLLWVLAYDTLYGMVDKKDDLKIGLKSTAIFFGEADLHITAFIQGLFIFGMVLVGAKFELNLYYYASLAIATSLIIGQLYSCRKKEPRKCFAAFLNNNWVGLVIFVGILVAKWTAES